MTNLAAGYRHRATRPSCRSSPLDALYRSERAGVLAYLIRKVGPEHACDLAQEVFIRAATSAQLADLRNPGGFLRCIARNLAIDFVRRKRCRISTLPIVENLDTPCDPAQEDRLHALQTEELFEQALAALPPKTAQVFAMSRFERKSYREIQVELGVAVSTVEYHMMKALAHLRLELDWVNS